MHPFRRSPAEKMFVGRRLVADVGTGHSLQESIKLTAMEIRR